MVAAAGDRMSRTEALRLALEHVWSGAGRVDAECVEDHLGDLGFEVVEMSAARRGSKRSHAVELPLAGTRGLPKKRSGG